jgi:hypothetical protein
MTEAEPIDHPAWPLRAALLLALGALFGLAFHFLTHDVTSGTGTLDAPRFAAATFLAVGGIVFAFSLERLRWPWAAAFAAAGGLVVALVGWWHGPPEGWGAGEGWQFAASLVSVAVAVPLFQAARDAGGRRFAVRAVHSHVWANLILWCAAWAFVGATVLLVVLLSELFGLIGLDQLKRLMEKGWFMWPLACGALGAAIGLLRDRDKVLGTLQRVVRAVLSVLAPVLALGLVVFVLALPFTGLEPLWSQTKATTPILLVCILGAVVLVNASIGNAREEEADARVLRYAAVGLAAVMLPLAFVAALSTWKRIGQYGFTPDRLWAAVFVAIAAAAAAAYLAALIRGRGAWPDFVRRANVRLAAGICLLALLLALPIVSFGAISARDQLARLESGRVSPDRFDWAAMRYDFGPTGRRALETLAREGRQPLRQRARDALKAADRWALSDGRGGPVAAPLSPPLKLRAEPAGTPIPPALLDRLRQGPNCHYAECRLVFDSPRRALVLASPCDRCPVDVYLYLAESDGGWRPAPRAPDLSADRTEDPGARARMLAGRIEVRTVEKRQVFVDGQAVGPVFAP